MDYKQMKTFTYRVFIKVWLLSAVCLGLFAKVDKDENVTKIHTKPVDSKNQFALIGGGCFWCTEAVFEQIDGIMSVISGYAGGQTKNPTYKDICTGKTGHAEVIKIHFDSQVVTFSQILEIFGNAHDPTTLNRQGADVGTQYRSTIMFYDEKQKKEAELWKEKLTSKLVDSVVTEIVPAPKFYPAEEYHQDYYAKNPEQGYCSFVIRPKLKKLGLE
jgi:peptide-methionine (S)-S-oxide reductase